jgi:hypothetical protein
LLCKSQGDRGRLLEQGRVRRFHGPVREAPVARTVISHASEAERMLSQVTRAHALNGAGVFTESGIATGASSTMNDRAFAVLSKCLIEKISEPHARLPKSLAHDGLGRIEVRIVDIHVGGHW